MASPVPLSNWLLVTCCASKQPVYSYGLNVSSASEDAARILVPVAGAILFAAFKRLKNAAVAGLTLRIQSAIAAMPEVL